MAWKIYYGNGSTFSDTDGPPEKAPALNIQVIGFTDAITAQEVGCQLLHSKDFYWWENNVWLGGDLFGLMDYLLRARGSALVLFGRAVLECGKHAWYPEEQC